MKKYGFLTLILCLFCLGEAAVASPGKADAAPAAQAQSSKLTVKGFVKDDKGDPMIGVTLIVKGTNFGTVSNADGSYSIDVPYGGATLMVSYIGYAPQEINVNNRTKIDITLLEDSKALEEVVVVGYNVQKKETITGSIATITTKDLKQSPTANINNALAGRMPGLLVNQFSGGEPGNDAAQLNIRGISTYGQSGVIMIVDGIERDMSYLAPDEIETFTILKDASATAPYGIRGANGVIVVTTKRGRKGEKPTVDFKASVGISEPIRYPDYLGSTTPRSRPTRLRSSRRRRSTTTAAPKATTPTGWVTTGIISTMRSSPRYCRITASRYAAARTAPATSSWEATTSRAATTSTPTPTTPTTSCAITSAPTSTSTPPNG